jgi:hypothetical protein
MATRQQNERDFPNWLDLPEGGRRYWVDKPGRVRGFARYVKMLAKSNYGLTMITQDVLADKILAYLNGQIRLEDLVHWAEDSVVVFTESNVRPENADTVWDTLLYIGAADNVDFPLTWEVLKEMLEQLGRPVQSVVA